MITSIVEKNGKSYKLSTWIDEKGKHHCELVELKEQSSNK